jgi:lipopolysaccharide transport system ATP-binding protein
MIEAVNVTKFYTGFGSTIQRIGCALSLGYYGGSTKYKALDNISFEIKKGEFTGIIGRNGAGKSTLLKLLTGVSHPTSGKIKTSGSLRSVLELGVGFNMELSGIENVFYNALVWGFSKKEIFNLEDEIFYFSGLEDYKSIPLKNYSTGMAMRLAFSLATASRPEILLIDEALAVGDASFQQKCISRLEKFIEEGSSIVVVSHDLSLLSSIASRILLLEKGKLAFDGKPQEAIENYMQILGMSSFDSHSEINSLLNHTISLGTKKNPSQRILFLGEDACLKISFSLKEDVESITIGFHIDDVRGIRVFGTNTNLLGVSHTIKSNKNYSCIFEFPINLKEGKYSIGISIHQGENHIGTSFLWKEQAIDFEVERTNHQKFEGLSFLKTKCKFIDN